MTDDAPDQTADGSHSLTRRAPRLDCVDRVRREAVRLYREGRDGVRPAGDVHHLTASLAIIGSMLEGQGR